MKTDLMKRLNEGLKDEKLRKAILGKLVYAAVLASAVLILYNVMFKEYVRENIIVDNNGGSEIQAEQTKMPDVYDEVVIQEEKLQEILSKIKGVGETDVMITYESSTEIVPAFNIQENTTTKEQKSNNGEFSKETNKDTSTDIVSKGQEDIVVLKEIKPKVKGVIVVADGAADVVTKNNIINAVSAVFNIPVNKVTVFEKKSR